MSQEPLQLPWSTAIQERFGFDTPPAFRALEARGLFRWADEFRHADLSTPGDRYLWFNEMEWYQPDELRSFEFETHHKSGFIPFAHAANGDYWCWYPAMRDKGSIPVLLCPHDCYDADLYAPDFASTLYRHAVQYAAETRQEDEARQPMLKRWAVEFAPIWPAEWSGHIEHLASAPMAWTQYKPFVASTFGEQFAKPSQVRWMEEA